MGRRHCCLIITSKRLQYFTIGGKRLHASLPPARVTVPPYVVVPPHCQRQLVLLPKFPLCKVLAPPHVVVCLFNNSKMPQHHVVIHVRLYHLTINSIELCHVVAIAGNRIQSIVLVDERLNGLVTVHEDLTTSLPVRTPLYQRWEVVAPNNPQWEVVWP